MTKSYTINGLKIDTISPAPSSDVRFMSQRQLFALGTPEAVAELARRAVIINGRR